ncbi:MAG: class I SAM-dependent methyltransferase [Planctomycetes bacterium]|nr:class I SAM-dependent methyltransferase [Planctomycetota bacterium]
MSESSGPSSAGSHASGSHAPGSAERAATAPSSHAEGRSERWFEAAFRADYLRVYPHRNVEAAVREVEFLLAHGVRGSVLDLCCGFGRHTLLLRGAGVRAFGLDLSFDLLRAARTLDGYGERLRGRLVRADAMAIPFGSGRFDAVVNLFSSFGYFGDEGDARVLREVERVLAPGGLAVFDLMNAERVRRELVPHSRRNEAAFVLDERRTLSESGRRVVKDVDLAFADGRRLAWREDVRLYDCAEFDRLLADHGFSRLETFGDFDGRAHDAHSPRMLVFARRHGESHSRNVT